MGMGSSVMYRKQRGVGMIEVLVALLVMSIGVLGFAGLQLRALNSSNQSHFRTQATAIAQSVVERISVNLDSRATYLSSASWGQGAMTKAQPGGWDACVTSACTSAQVAAWDILQSRWLAWTLLPNGHISTGSCAAMACVVVSWGDADTATCDPSEDDCVMLEVLP